jgi:peptidoglycan/LPS O-acetylase OafA/YrhL
VEPDGSKLKLAYLDGLRGLAAIIVVLNHFACAFLPVTVFGDMAVRHFRLEHYIYVTPLQLFIAGNFAVCIFFALSGFVLSQGFFASGEDHVARSGATKRYFRLMPPILSAVLLSWAIYKLGLTSHLQAAQISGSSEWLARLWPHSVTLHGALRQGLYGALLGTSNPAIFDNVLWTMNMEFFGSFYVFGFLALFGNMRRRWIVYLVLLALSWNTFYLAFLFGVILSDASVNRSELQLSRPVLSLALLTGLILGSVPTISNTHTFFSQVFIPWLPTADLFVLPHVLGAGLVLMVVVYSRTLKRVLAVRPLRYIGKISFSMYLIHILVIGTLTCALLRALAPHMSYLHALTLSLVLTVPVIWLVAHYFTRFIDTPAVKLGSWVNAHWFWPNH